MNIFEIIREQIQSVIREHFGTPNSFKDLDLTRVSAELPRDPKHGDIATNAAMLLSKALDRKPHEIASDLLKPLTALPNVEQATIAGPGFINLKIKSDVWYDSLSHILKVGTSFGVVNMGDGIPVNIEYVSANPTGPMHVGHARGAVFGDVLARLLKKVGYEVTKEYYVNDAGAQIDALVQALQFRYFEALGIKTQDQFDQAVAAGEIEYAGTYLKEVARALVKRDGDRWANTDDSAWSSELRSFVIDQMMSMIKGDLESLGVYHDVFTSELRLQESGKIEEAVDFLSSEDLVYTGTLPPPRGKTLDGWESRPLLLFRAEKFGDDSDRPLKKADGSWTYFAGDIAYHKDKVDRGFAELINIWGADHVGDVKRVRAATAALTDGKGQLDVKLCQMVKVLDNGKPVRMSKRAGTFVTLRDLIEAVGKDVVRFIMLTRKNDAQLDFDYSKVTEKSRENSVFYVQYAYARVCSVMRQANEVLPNTNLTDEALAEANLLLLTDRDELELIKNLAAWPRAIEAAAGAHEPHRIAFYLYDLAGRFHALWNRGNDSTDLRFLQPRNVSLTLARLALVRGVAVVIASGLEVFGVEPLQEMR